MPKGIQIEGDDLALLRRVSDRVRPEVLEKLTGISLPTLHRAIAGDEISTRTAPHLMKYVRKLEEDYAKQAKPRIIPLGEDLIEQTRDHLDKSTSASIDPACNHGAGPQGDDRN